MDFDFVYDNRLGICLPYLEKEWKAYPEHVQGEILLKWEKIRGKIPDRIKEIEKTIEHKQEMLGQEDDFEASCKINADICELASIINDLWIWFRTRQYITHANMAKK